MKFSSIFKKDLPIIGMIHLTGKHPVRQALEEIAIFEEEGLDGVIVENYHGNVQDVLGALHEIKKRGTKVKVGINILPNDFVMAFSLAQGYGAQFIQMDHIAGTYTRGELDADLYNKVREVVSDVAVLGGVWPKYYEPVYGSSLEKDIQQGMQRADAIVVTGSGTGKETPMEKIRMFRSIMGNYPLIVGAGLTPDNAYEQLLVGDGAIVGSSLKVDNNTENKVDLYRVRDVMDAVREVRKIRD